MIYKTRCGKEFKEKKSLRGHRCKICSNIIKKEVEELKNIKKNCCVCNKSIELLNDNKNLQLFIKNLCSINCRNSKSMKNRKILWGDKISKSLKGKKLSIKHKEALIKNHVGMFGKKHKFETIQKMRLIKIGKNNPLFGKNLSNEHRRKIRIAIIKHIEKTGFIRCFIGKNEKIILDEQEKINNCKIIRQYHIKELGYVVDGYCQETNMVYEIYEPFHYCNKEKTEKDLKRQKEIQNFLNCNFIIIEDHGKNKMSSL